MLLCLAAASTSLARPQKDFLRGPYFMVGGGIMGYSADKNIRLNKKVGRDYEPDVGFVFGWNIVDYIAPELQVRYATNKNSGNREHLVTANINCVVTPIIDGMTDWENVKILPFVQGGPALHMAAVPGDPASSDKTIPLWAPGFGVGGGLRFLFGEYVFAALLAQVDFVDMPAKYQDIGGKSTKILAGGWDTEPSFNGMIGVHF